MAKKVYVDGINGDNLNDGLTLVTAKQTILGARSVTAAGDTVLISPGVYLEGDVTWGSAGDVGTLYIPNPDLPGMVIVDFQDVVGTLSGYHWNIATPVLFRNIIFRNSGPTGFFGCSGDNSAYPWFRHCVFANPGTQRGVALTSFFASRINIENCTFYNLSTGFLSFNDNNGASFVYNCYFNDVATPFNGFNVGIPRDYNAYSGNPEANGIDTDVTDPGLRDAPAGDYRLDPVTDPAAFETFMVSSRFGGRLAAFGKGGLSVEYLVPQLRSLNPTALANPNPLWENEGPNGTNTYLDGTPGDIIENLATFELEIDLATTPGATGGRIRSPVFDLGASSPLLTSVAFQSFQDIINGSALDIDTTLPQQWEWRGSNSVFAAGDVSPSWNASDFGVNLSQSFRYIQIRITFVRNHTNT